MILNITDNEYLLDYKKILIVRNLSQNIHYRDKLKQSILRGYDQIFISFFIRDINYSLKVYN